MIPREHNDVMAEMIRKYAKEHDLIPPGQTIDIQICLKSESSYLYDDPYKSFGEFCERINESKWIMTRALNIFEYLGFKTIKDVANYGTKDFENWHHIYGINSSCKTLRIIKEWLHSIDLDTGMDFNFLNNKE